jgi:hypothetical protein
MASSGAPPRPTFGAINVLRLLFQIFIAVHNGHTDYWRAHSLFLARIGRPAVLVFFAMASLLSHQSLSKKLRDTHDATQWVRRRVWRLFPGHALITLCGVLSKVIVPGSQTEACGRPTVLYEFFVMDAVLPNHVRGLMHPYGRCVGLTWFVVALVQLTAITPVLVVLSKRRWGVAVLLGMLVLPRAIGVVPPWTLLLYGSLEAWLIGLLGSVYLQHESAVVVVAAAAASEAALAGTATTTGAAAATGQRGTSTWGTSMSVAANWSQCLGWLGWSVLMVTFYVQSVMHPVEWELWGEEVALLTAMASLVIIVADVKAPCVGYRHAVVKSLAGVTYEAYLFGASTGIFVYKGLLPAMAAPTLRNMYFATVLHMMVLIPVAYAMHWCVESVLRPKAEAWWCCGTVGLLGEARGALDVGINKKEQSIAFARV